MRERLEREKREKMKIEDLKVGRVYRAKRPRVVHTLGGSYIVEFIFKYTTFKRKKLPNIFEKYKERVRTIEKRI